MSSHSQDEWADLVEQTKRSLPKELGSQAWYLLLAATLSTSPNPELLAEFYTYLTQHEKDFKSEETVQKLSLQLRDVLLKQITLIGAPQVLMALTPLAAAEGSPQEKAKNAQLNEKWQNLKPAAEIHARGTDTIHSIYGQPLLHNRIFPQWGDHSADIVFNEIYTVYGIYLSDFEYLTALETELVVFTTISCLGLGTGPALWHLRGLGRLLGARGEDDSQEAVRKAKDILRGVKVSLMTVVEFVGEEFVRRAKFDTWPNVGDVIRVLNGWGEDA